MSDRGRGRERIGKGRGRDRKVQIKGDIRKKIKGEREKKLLHAEGKERKGKRFNRVRENLAKGENLQMKVKPGKREKGKERWENFKEKLKSVNGKKDIAEKEARWKENGNRGERERVKKKRELKRIKGRQGETSLKYKNKKNEKIEREIEKKKQDEE